MAGENFTPPTLQRESYKEESDQEVEWIVEGEEEEETKVTLEVVGRIWTERNVNSNALIVTP